eukprot:CAMPEP_0203673576 /NCGR_PEP_ID=MMETSP0090-20130426/13051_1 /ASSEMBLY_ACC=CAM_ASM_001088 /TAXON_ID=426623 /ORGANISM="Chaetoceros affinis, Strain CCMP159" /LENGTH=370 /DNA_ID=CAMNT_0050539265 /DNA_START=33 /DNA_END=1142 /DNA_ORIENTATION=-
MSSGSKDYSSHSAFSSIDALASKPILGSDGAASWQEFRNQSKSSSASSGGNGGGIAKRTMMSRGTAPHMPVKKTDKLGTGFRSIAEEREHEEKMRDESNDAKMNSGYTTFKRKQDRAELMERKKRKMIEERIRPDDVKYFIPAETFQGWKEDYVFTTKSRGVGYYWDGMDSLKKLNGVESYVGSGVSTGEGNADNSSAPTKETGDVIDSKLKKKKKKKKKKKDGITASDEVDTNNPMEQVLSAMRRRTELQSRPPGSSNQIAMETKAVLTGTISLSTLQNSVQSATILNGSETAELARYDWEAAVDPSSGKTYFFSRKSGERQWDNPIEKLRRSQGSHDTGDKLPDGWRPAKDAAGRTYYYHRESGKTSW